MVVGATVAAASFGGGGGPGFFGISGFRVAAASASDPAGLEIPWQREGEGEKRLLSGRRGPSRGSQQREQQPLGLGRSNIQPFALSCLCRLTL